MIRPHTHPPPEGWMTLMAPHFGVPQKLVSELWVAYAECCPQKVPTLLYQLAAITDVIQGEDPHEAMMPRIAYYIHVLTPQDLLAATARLSPEGRQRRKDVIDLERVILANVTRRGAWK